MSNGMRVSFDLGEFQGVKIYCDRHLEKHTFLIGVCWR
jgi:hypothetical protein